MSLNTTPRTFVTGEIETAAIFNAELRDALTGIQSAWTAYTPTLTNVTLGNGVLTGRNQRIGKTIHYSIQFTMGSTSAVTGVIGMTLPVLPQNTAARMPFAAHYLDAFVNSYAGVAVFVTTALAFFSSASPAAQVAAAVPFAWGVGDQLFTEGTYEAA